MFYIHGTIKTKFAKVDALHYKYQLLLFFQILISFDLNLKEERKIYTKTSFIT